MKMLEISYPLNFLEISIRRSLNKLISVIIIIYIYELLIRLLFTLRRILSLSYLAQQVWAEYHRFVDDDDSMTEFACLETK